MYTPKRLKSNPRGDSPLSSPFPSRKASSDRTTTPSRGVNASRLKDTPSRGAGTPSRVGTPSRGVNVVEQDETYQLLSYGGNLPVKVAELLAAGTGDNLSARIEQSGWALLIDNRKLFAWKVSSNLIKKTMSCFEFQLPASSSAHQSCLVAMLESNQNNVSKTSLVCVSTEGSVRYWPSLTQPTVFVESTVNMDSDARCCRVQAVMPYGCVVVTNTNQLYQLSPSNSTIGCHHISTNTGVLSSIGKRMSSFWSQPTLNVCKYPPVLCNGTIDCDADERYFFLSADHKLQKWELVGTAFGMWKMLFQVDLRICVNDYTGLKELTSQETVDDVQVLDMKTTGYGIVMLLRLIVPGGAISVIGTFKTSSDDYMLERLQRIDSDGGFDGELDLLVPFGGYQAYISNSNTIVSLPLIPTTRGPVKVSLRKGAGILGVGCIGTETVYLTQRDGLVNLKVSYVPEPILLEQTQVNMLNDSSVEQIGTTADPTDVHGILRSAFILHSQGKVQNIINVISSIEPNKDVTDAVKKVSVELLDGYPPSDPRWSTSNPAFPPTSVLLLNQLRDKEKIHEEYLNFLSVYDVLDKISSNELIDDVKIYLCENAEMLRCAITLLELPSHLGDIIDDVINSPYLSAEVDESDEQTNRKDAFFGKVTHIAKFFHALLKFEADELSSIQAIQKQVDIILYISEIVTSCFQSAWQYRQNTPHRYTSLVHVPWTCSSAGNRVLLAHQIDLIITQALGNVDSVKSGCGLTRQTVLLSDLLFDGYIREVASLKGSGSNRAVEMEEEYNGERTRVISALMKAGYIEEATTLAEHYKDFKMLIVLSEETNDVSKLKYYKGVFKEDGFNDILYKWYVEKGAWKQLMTNGETENFDTMLATHKQLNWLHFLGANEYAKASDALTQLASDEKELNDRKKSMLVLANLSILAADAPSEAIEEKMATIDQHLDVVNYQEQIFASLNKDASEAAPMSPDELINLCLDDNTGVLTEPQYITLVELLQLIPVSDDRRPLLLDIWAKCVLQEEWDESLINVDSVAVVSQKTFYKCLRYWRDAEGINNNHLPLLRELTTRLGDSMSGGLEHQLKVCYEALGMQQLSVGA